MATEQTRTDILDAAERLFAEKGFAGTSTREITREAGVNVAAVHYHFGSKKDVLRGVTDRVVGPLNKRRFELLEAAQRRSNPAALEEVLDAFFRPDIETLHQLQERGPTVAHFLSQIYSDRTPWMREMTYQQFAEISVRFFPAIAAAVPDLGMDAIGWKMERVTAIVVHLFASWPESGLTAEESENEIARLISFVAAGLRGPFPSSIEG